MGKAIARVLHAPPIEDVEADEADMIQAAGTHSCIRDRTATQSWFSLALAKPKGARSSDSNPDLRGPMKGGLAVFAAQNSGLPFAVSRTTSTGVTCLRLDGFFLPRRNPGPPEPAFEDALGWPSRRQSRRAAVQPA
jgi:hypothetical protein